MNEEDVNKINILYRPNLGIPKNYYSDGKIDYEKTTSTPSGLDSNSEDLKEQIELIKRSLLFVPSEIRPQTESILNLVYFLFTITDAPSGNEDDTTYDVIKPNVETGVTSTETNKDVNIFFKDHKPVTILKQTVTDDVKLKRYYSNSTLEITRYYINKLGDILATYHSQLFAHPKAKDYLEEVYNTGLNDYKDYAAHSILQTLLKSQQEKISKMRLYRKLYNEKQSLTILKSLEYTKLSLLKLIGNAPKDPKLYYKHIQTIETEKKRLDKKMFEYYRYLDSSLEILSNCLNMHLTEGIAKAELHKINNEKGE